MPKYAGWSPQSTMTVKPQYRMQQEHPTFWPAPSGVISMRSVVALVELAQPLEDAPRARRFRVSVGDWAEVSRQAPRRRKTRKACVPQKREPAVDGYVRITRLPRLKAKLERDGHL